MTQAPYPQVPPYELGYQSAHEHGNAPILVKLAGIFNIVAGGLDALYGLAMAGLVLVMFFSISRVMAMPPPPMPPPPVAPAPAAAGPALPGPEAPPPEAPAPVPAPPIPAPAVPAPVMPPPPPMPTHADLLAVYLIYGIPAVLSLAASLVKIMGGIRLLRRKRKAWAWGLTCGIVGCVELWMFLPCCVTVLIPVACGIFTIIAMSLPHVRQYLMVQEARAAS